jgi:hypothetical protein
MTCHPIKKAENRERGRRAALDQCVIDQSSGE